MASSRKIQSPGIELNEIDRSQYGDKVDYSLPNSPNVLLVGFASKGEDYALQWINSRNTLDDTYGTPTNEYEKYFYNGITEILKRGATCIAAKLPYDNNSMHKYNYVSFSLALCCMQENKESDQDNSTQIDGVLCALNQNDSNLTSYVQINALSNGIDPLSVYDDYLTSNKSVGSNMIKIYDITHSQYKPFNTFDVTYLSSIDDNKANDFLGIMPVIVTPANALFFQNMLQFNTNDVDKSLFNQVSKLSSMTNTNVDSSNLSDVNAPSCLVVPFQSIDPALSSETDYTLSVGYDQLLQWTTAESVSRIASMYFPTMNYDSTGHFSNENMKKIGIVVLRAFKDTQNNGKINFEVLESFVGSLDQQARDPITLEDLFIDNVVNASSQFIRVFSNANRKNLQTASTIAMSQQTATTLGFYAVDCKKHISFTQSILDPLTYILDKAQNKYTLPLDIVIDAGMSNIAQIAKSLANSDEKIIDAETYPNISHYQNSFDIEHANLPSSGWKMVLKKFDDFAKYTRKDCMFLADGLRSFCIYGNEKIVRKTALGNNVTKSIIPNLKYMSSPIESSYSAGYCNWYFQQDSSSRDFFWIPPSIKAAGVFIYCDTYFQPWSAPAGNTRGTLQDVVDVAFVPNEDDAGKIYNAQWNYAMSYPIEGIVIEGHKTFQSQKTALDRINVRRLLLYLEKSTIAIARRFVYEGNTQYTRQSFVDALRPIYETTVARGGIREYAIKCDDEINTPQVIENNEIRCRIAVKPVKVVDFIVIDFIATRQSANVNEEVLR